MKRRASGDVAAALLTVLLGAALAGCGGAADGPVGSPAGSASGSLPATGGPSTSEGPRPPDAGAWAGDPCALLSPPDIATVFPAGPPDPQRKDYGAGFAECRWEQAAVRLRVAVMPVSDLTADYIDKLNPAPSPPQQRMWRARARQEHSTSRHRHSIAPDGPS